MEGTLKEARTPGDGFRGALEPLKSNNNNQLPKNINGFSLVLKGQPFWLPHQKLWSGPHEGPALEPLPEDFSVGFVSP